MNAIKVQYLRSWLQVSNRILRYMLFGISSGLLFSLPIYGQLPPDVQFRNLKEKEVKLAANDPIYEYTWSCCQGANGGVMQIQQKGNSGWIIGNMKDNTNGTDGMLLGTISWGTNTSNGKMSFTRDFVFLNGEHSQQIYSLTVSQNGQILDGEFWTNIPNSSNPKRYKFTATYSKAYY